MYVTYFDQILCGGSHKRRNVKIMSGEIWTGTKHLYSVKTDGDRKVDVDCAGSLTQAIRNFAKSLEGWLKTAMQGIPEDMIKAKVGPETSMKMEFGGSNVYACIIY